MILVDPREGSGDMLGHLKARTNGQATMAKPSLHGGDFAFEGNGPNGDLWIGIERKAMGDMLGSMRSDRLAGIQLPKMTKLYQVCYVIVEGQYKADKDGVLMKMGYDREKRKYGWVPYTLAARGPASRQYFMFAEFDKFVCSLENRKNVIIVYSHDEMTTIWQVVNRFAWWQKSWDSHQSADPIKLQAEVTFTRTSLLRRFASYLEGIGWAKSKDVERHFKTVEAMVTALPSEWTEIEFRNKNGGISHMSHMKAAELWGKFRREEKQ